MAVVEKEREKPVPDQPLLEENLGEPLYRLHSRLERHKHPQLKLQDCALIVRCILAVWASRVPKPESPDWTDDPIVSTQPRIKGSATLIDLPQLMAFA